MSDTVTIASNGIDHTAPVVAAEIATPRKPRVLSSVKPQFAASPGKGKAKVTVAASSIAAMRAHLTRAIMVRDGSKPGSNTHIDACAQIASREKALRAAGVDPYAVTPKANNKAQRLAALRSALKDCLPGTAGKLLRDKLNAQIDKLGAVA